jgi:outer membrane protein OmpA-like peptidoglycan-associated protein
MTRAREREPERPERPRDEPPAPKPAPVDAILTLQKTAGDAAVSAAIQRAPRKRPSGPKGGGDQEQSWANPSRGVADTPALVATIYFKTRDTTTDAQDEAVLREVARAYAPWATRNAQTKGADKGLRGRIVGYADPRHSAHPDNLELSADRADIVERRLNRFLVDETAHAGLIPRDFDFDKEAGGVAPADPEADLGAEEMSLGWMRRAEVYIAGQAVDPQPPAHDTPPPPPEPVKPPADGWERWVPYIQKCDARITEGVSMQVLAYLAGWGKLTRQAFDYTGRLPIMIPTPGLPTGPKGKDLSPDIPGPSITYGKHGGVLPFSAKKPPWWDARTSGYPSQYLGRSALSPQARKCRALADKALMLIADMRRVNEYIDRTVTHSTSAYVLFMAELRKDEPDVAKLREYAVPIEELMFIWDQTLADSIEVGKMARDM